MHGSCRAFMPRTGGPPGPAKRVYGFPFFHQRVSVPAFKRGKGHKSSQVHSGKVDRKNSVSACPRCDLTRPNVARRPWRQVPRHLSPDEHPCRQGTLHKAIAKSVACKLAPFAVPAPVFEFRFPLGNRRAPPKVGYNQHLGFQEKNMRTATRLLAILTIAALLAPGMRWASLRAQTEACACPPAACMCAGHPHSFGHSPRCAMANGGQCGLDSHDSYLGSLLGTLIYVPTEHPWADPLSSSRFGCQTSNSSLLPAHARIPERPPRASL